MTHAQRAQARTIVATKTKVALDISFFSEIQASGCKDWDMIYEIAKLMLKTKAITESFEGFKKKGLPVDQILKDRYLMGQLREIMDSMILERWRENVPPPENDLTGGQNDKRFRSATRA